VRTQKLMWHNIMRSTKSHKASVLHYSINIDIDIDYTLPRILNMNVLPILFNIRILLCEPYIF
jgi:hypothetical protein